MVAVLERHYRQHLDREPGFETWFKDSCGRNYVVLVSSKSRLSVAGDMLKDEARSVYPGVLAIGLLDSDRMAVFTGSFAVLAAGEGNLHHRPSDGHYYRFMVDEDWTGTRLAISGKGGRAGRGGYLGPVLTRLEKIDEIELEAVTSC